MSAADAKADSLALRIAANQRKFRAETKERARLLREIGKKRAACQWGQQRARDIERELQQGLGVLQLEWSTTGSEVQSLVRQLLDVGSRLDKRERATLRRHCSAVLPASVWPQEEAASKSVGPADGDAASRCSEPGRYDTEAGPSASKPSDPTTSLRAVFRRLVLGLHPDTAPDEQERERRNELMKAVTQAYEAGDWARLVELERRCLADVSQLADERPTAAELSRLIEQNRVLRHQLRKLAAEWKTLRDRSLGAASAGEREREAEQHVRKQLAPLRHELGWLRRFREQLCLLYAGDIVVAELIAATTAE